MSYYVAGSLAIALLALLYWTRPARRRQLAQHRGMASVLLVLVIAGLATCLVSVRLERPDHVVERGAKPVAIAVAFDLSPSMRAVPNPALEGEQPPRFERAKAALGDFFRTLEERRQPVYVSIVGFTREAQIIMGWDQSIGQVQDILEYAIAPDLFGSTGTSIEAAVGALDDAFAMLPAAAEADSRKLAIIVSDGEDTMRASSFDYAKLALADAGFDLIALQAGLLDAAEGLPVYGAAGDFEGFRTVGGERFTVPDVGAMQAIADAPARAGLYLRAEMPDTVARMAAFAAGGGAGRRAPGAAWLSTFGMFAVVSVLSAVIIR